MKAFRDGENASKVDVKIANPEGLQPDTPKIRGAVKYAARGGGKIKARAKGNKTFDSSKSVKRSYIEGVKESGAELINAARSLVKRILGRDE